VLGRPAVMTHGSGSRHPPLLCTSHTPPLPPTISVNYASFASGAIVYFPGEPAVQEPGPASARTQAGCSRAASDCWRYNNESPWSRSPEKSGGTCARRGQARTSPGRRPAGRAIPSHGTAPERRADSSSSLAPLANLSGERNFRSQCQLYTVANLAPTSRCGVTNPGVPSPWTCVAVAGPGKDICSRPEWVR
jgi:hypothetical protein